MDIVQDALMSALRDLDDFTYSNEGDFMRWLSGIAENKIRGNLVQLHAAKRDMRREVPLEQRLSSTRSQGERSKRREQTRCYRASIHRSPDTR